jgi:WD40 repeat protein
MALCTSCIYFAQVAMEAILPTSANWYCSRIIDGNEQGIVCIGAKNSVDVWQVSNSTSVTQHIATIRAHDERVVGVSLCRQQHPSSNIVLPTCCSVGEDGKVRVWNLNSKEMIKEHNSHKV